MKTVEFKYVGDVAHGGNFNAWLPNGKTYELSGTYVLTSEAEAEIEKVKRHPCCKYPGYCGGECTCKTCAPELHIIEFECKLREAKAEISALHAEIDDCHHRLHAASAQESTERERVLVKALENLVNKLLRVHADPEYMAVWSIYQAHVHDGYKGLTYTKELNDARAALERVKEG